MRDFNIKLSFIGFLLFLSWACTPVSGLQAGRSADDIPEQFYSLLELYRSPEDSLKYKAAQYLLEGLPSQWHYDVSLFDSTGITRQVWDTDIIDVGYLAENIEYAFKAWDLPWCRDLSFDEFCHWILPYKMANEEPIYWRKQMLEKYADILNYSLANSLDAHAVCKLVNDSVNEWFNINWDDPYALDINYNQAEELKEGDCYRAALMILYPLRALGVPSVLDGVPQWGNRSHAHKWNGVYNKGYFCTFNGPERNPGGHKIQFVGVGRMHFKMPKVWRKDYLEGRIDVTQEYVQVCDVTIDRIPRKYHSTSLAGFDNRNWQALADEPVTEGRSEFKNMARDIVYLPMGETKYGTKKALGYPILIDVGGNSRILKPSHSQTEQVHLLAKYPEDPSNLILPGDLYELFYWDKRWISLGRQIPKDTFLDYDGVPCNALLWLRDLSQGVQERIFIYENDCQVWY